MPANERAQVLVTVKAYPQLGKKLGEVVCVAGARLDKSKPEWIRLFPVHFRDLDEYQKFKKYDVIELDVSRGRKDSRPESRIPMQGSISVVRSVATGKDQLWSERRDLLGDLVGDTSMCELVQANTKSGRASAPSLGLIKPEVLDVRVEKNAEFDAEKRHLARMASEATLFAQAKAELEPSPYVVKYHYRCAAPACASHTQSYIDWEVGQAGRKWSTQYPEDEIPGRIHAKFLDQLCGPDREPYFFVGNTHQWLNTFLVLGVFWPKRTDQTALF